MQRYTFPKTERLLKKKSFLEVYEHGRKTEGEYLILFVLSGTATRKVGVRVSSRVGNAVKRNRAKRLIKEAYRLNKNKLIKNIHLVIAAKPNIVGLKYNDIEKDLLNLYNKVETIEKQ